MSNILWAFSKYLICVSHTVQLIRVMYMKTSTSQLNRLLYIGKLNRQQNQTGSKIIYRSPSLLSPFHFLFPMVLEKMIQSQIFLWALLLIRLFLSKEFKLDSCFWCHPFICSLGNLVCFVISCGRKKEGNEGLLMTVG